MASQPFLDAVAARRSIYNLTKTLPQSTTESRILEIVKHALAYAPSPFNMRSCRCIVLFGEEHERLWQEGYRVTAEGPHGGAAIQVLGPKIKAFEAGAGTVSWLLNFMLSFDLHQKSKTYVIKRVNATLY
jgi:predicted oxidoreductase (fatty acid repression mutant protein)